MKYIFEAGDKVVKKKGGKFSNGSRWVTVEMVTGQNTIWFKETQTNLSSDSLLPYHETEQQVVLKKLEMKRNEIQEESERLKYQLELKVEALKQLDVSIQIMKGLF